MAPDFDTLRRMWRCHCLRLVSFYHMVYVPPKDMSDLWKQMETTHSLYHYDGQPDFPSKQTPDSVDQYLNSSASAFLRYKDKYHSKKLETNHLQSWLRYFLVLVMSLLVMVHSLRCKNKTYFGMVLLFVVVLLYGYSRNQKKLRDEKNTAKRKLVFYKDPPDNDVSYLVPYLPSHFEWSKNKNECDFILSTKFTWGVPGFEPHQSFLTEYGKQPKKVLVFWITDSNDIFEVPSNVYFFRTSLFRRWRNPTEDVLPFVFDPFEEKDFHIFAPTSKPIIGFCGGSWPIRKKTLATFRKDDRFQTNYVEHEHFSAGTREMYKENIQHSHFTICDRGNGNFTMRMWHVLSLGRVPILVEDDMVFPFYNEIDWNKICIRAQNPQELAEKTLTFYHTYKMEQVQALCWETYQQYFTRERYLNKVCSKALIPT